MNIPENYLREIKMIMGVARGYLSEGRELVPMAFLGKTGLPLLPFPMDMSSNQAKDASAEAVREFAKMAGAEYAIMISEAWALDHTQISKEEVLKLYESRKGIADHPARQDVVMITLETQAGFWFANTPIKSLGGEARGFGDPEFTFIEQLEGRFTHFLPQKSKTVH
jgi:hypothetical protein